MKARLMRPTYNVSATCPTCKTATSFEQRQLVVVDAPHMGGNGRHYNRALYVLSQCAACRLGGFAVVSDNGSSMDAYLDDFYPFSIDAANIPSGVPADVETEFREAEKCQALNMNRAASALFRSVLEKTLKSNGYTKGTDRTLTDLQKRIDAAAADGVITEARRKRAHDDIRVLGNDVLHDDWRMVADEEVEDAHRYMQRVLEDLYDDRPTVEAILIEKGRLPAPSAAADAASTATS